jgi:oxygen-independent coproporphyrinogen-3 oxidase
VILDGTPYFAYEYGYPHKTAYGRLSPAPSLASLWENERRSGLFLYFHVPFCEMRCGFCNLFTVANPREAVVDAWLATLARQAKIARAALGEAKFARFAVGGGTPTFLPAEALSRLFALGEETMGAAISSMPSSVEASPETLDDARLAVLKSFAVSRVSLGVQSFDEAEAAAMGRPQRRADVVRVLDGLRAAGVAVLNLDLIYGGEGQTAASFVASIREALKWRPEEMYLYPLYVRPKTGLWRHGHSADTAWDALRLDCYRAARDVLLSEGYAQASMRMFRRSDGPTVESSRPSPSPDGARKVDGPVYCVQDDGMVGLGVGARSYTQRVHYASEWAVSGPAVRDIVGAYIARSDEELARADWGYRLDDDEQQRRYVILTLLGDGLDLTAFRARFGVDARDALALDELLARGWSQLDGDVLRLTAAGLERSDAIGPWLRSITVDERIRAYVTQ